MKIFTSIFNSFFRTIGRILAYLSVGAIIVYVMSIAGCEKVKADVIPIDQIGGIMNNNSYDFPQFYWFSTDDLELDFGLYLYNYQGLTTPYSYLVYSVCSNTKLSVKIVNGGYTNYFSDDSAKIVSSGSNCTAGGYGGTLYYIQLQVGEYGDLDGTGSELVASSRIYYTSGYSWGGYLELRNFYLSSEDLVTSMINDQKQLDAMNKIENQITSTNNKLDQTNQKLDDTNNQLNNLNGNLTNSNSDEATNAAGNFFSGFTTDTFGLTSIITAPLNLITSITSSSCSPVGVPIPFVDKTLNLPCLRGIYEEHFGSFFAVYQTITFGIVAYWVIVRIFALVKDFKNPDHDEIEVLDL